MKKISALILAICMIAALIVPAYASGAEYDTGSKQYLAETIMENAQYSRISTGFSAYHWRFAPPSSDGMGVWLSFYCVTGEPGSGTVCAMIRTEEAIYNLSLYYDLSDYAEVCVTDNTELSDEYFQSAAYTHDFSAMQTRGGGNYIFGSIDPRLWTVHTAPTITESNIDNAAESALFSDLRTYTPYLADTIQYVVKDGGTMRGLGFYEIVWLCCWHDWDDGTIIREPTATRTGLMEYECQRCGNKRLVMIPKLQFSDVPENAWYAEAVDWAVENELTAGTSATDFSPNAECTRAEIVQMLWRSAGSPEADESPFTDVPESAWYAKAAAWAYENGVTTGVSETHFGPNLHCTRAQIVTMLWRLNGSPESEIQTRFSDVGGREWYAEAVRWAAERGITAGKRDNNSFAANDTCTRAEAVTFLWRADGGEE